MLLVIKLTFRLALKNKTENPLQFPLVTGYCYSAGFKVVLKTCFLIQGPESTKECIQNLNGFSAIPSLANLQSNLSFKKQKLEEISRSLHSLSITVVKTLLYI